MTHQKEGRVIKISWGFSKIFGGQLLGKMKKTPKSFGGKILNKNEAEETEKSVSSIISFTFSCMVHGAFRVG